MTRAPRLFPLLILLAAPVSAQTSFSASVGPGLTSSGTGDGHGLDVRAWADLEHALSAARARVFYDLETGDYATPGDWRFLSHNAGGSYRFDLRATGKDHLYLGGDATFRRNGESWSAADFNAAGGFANLDLNPRTGVNMRTGYRVDLRRFAAAPAFDQAEHSVFGSVLLNFQTRTTVIAQVTAGAKRYAAVSSSTQVVAVPPAHVSEQSLHGSGRRGGLGAMLVPAVTPGAPGSDARQVTLLARIAQSLAAKTGLSVEVSRRRVGGDVSPALVATPAEFIDDGIYDDLFASDAVRASVVLKSIVGYGIELSTAFTWLDKQYGSTLAFDVDGVPLEGVLRHDRVRLARVDTSWPLLRSRTGPFGLDLVGGYDYTRHRSTSALYEYAGHAIRLALGISY